MTSRRDYSAPVAYSRPEDEVVTIIWDIATCWPKVGTVGV